MYKLNSILMLPMKSCEDESMIVAYEQVYDKLKGPGHKPKLYILDNECSKCIQNFLEKKGTRRHHVTPHNHRVNAALDWSCPIQLWSRMVKQIQDTLNMFRTSRLDATKQLTRKQKVHSIGTPHHLLR